MWRWYRWLDLFKNYLEMYIWTHHWNHMNNFQLWHWSCPHTIEFCHAFHTSNLNLLSNVRGIFMDTSMAMQHVKHAESLEMRLVARRDDVHAAVYMWCLFQAPKDNSLCMHALCMDWWISLPKFVPKNIHCPIYLSLIVFKFCICVYMCVHALCPMFTVQYQYNTMDNFLAFLATMYKWQTLLLAMGWQKPKFSSLPLQLHYSQRMCVGVFGCCWENGINHESPWQVIRC